MNFLTSIVARTKFIVGGFKSSVSYLLGLIRAYLKSDDLKNRVSKAATFFKNAVCILSKYEKYCPTEWISEFRAIIVAISLLAEILSSSKASSDDISKQIASVEDAIGKLKL